MLSPADTVALVDFTPTLRLLLLALVAALLPLSWWWLRQRGSDRRTRLAALTALTLFLTVDLIVFGAFTRLTDSGLGCPDWPGCYGQASPLGAAVEIRAAQTALPSGPVTVQKAWIEMIHRYLAMAVGVLILVMAATAWWERWRGRAMPVSPWWPTATLVWVVVQGLFGKYTVTLKLYPAVVTLHLLGGLLLLVLLAAQHASYRPRPLGLRSSMRRCLALAAALLFVQITLGGWVSTNYAVLACADFPRCNGAWWPAMDFGAGFAVLRPLGQAAGGGYLPFEALVAIHMVHRLFAGVVALALLWLAVGLWRSGRTGGQPSGWPSGQPGEQIRGQLGGRMSDETSGQSSRQVGEQINAQAGEPMSEQMGGQASEQTGWKEMPSAQARSARRFGAAIAALTLAQAATGLGNIVLGWPIAAALMHSAGAAALVLLLALLGFRSRQAQGGLKPA